MVIHELQVLTWYKRLPVNRKYGVEPSTNRLNVYNRTWTRGLEHFPPVGNVVETFRDQRLTERLVLAGGVDVIEVA